MDSVRTLKRKKNKAKLTADALAEKATALIRHQLDPWWSSHPMAKPIADCLKRGISTTGLLRALHQEGYKDVSESRLRRYKRFLRIEG